jgi:hypothetical protein
MDVDAEAEDAYPKTPSSWVSIGILTRWEVEVEWVSKSRWDGRAAKVDECSWYGIHSSVYDRWLGDVI